MVRRVEFDEKNTYRKRHFSKKRDLMILLRCYLIKISPFGWLPYPLQPLKHISISLPPSLFLVTNSSTPPPLPHPQRKNTSHIHYPHYLFLSGQPEVQPYWKKNSRKNGKLYGRSSQSSRIHVFFIRKLFFCLSLNFLNITLEIRLRFS